jgi:predicted AlkP superfamily pyrophosphatase or phosphodiesterase
LRNELRIERDRSRTAVDSVVRKDLENELKFRIARRFRSGDQEHLGRPSGARGRHRIRGARFWLRQLRRGLALLTLLLPLPALAAGPVVIVLSWDGTRHDYPERTSLPALERMAREGIRAARLVPVFPVNTFTNHVTLATGAHADRHGIVGNRFQDRERGRFDHSDDASWLEAEPLWVAAERQGVRAAVFFWVGSETDWNGIGASYRRTPFDSAIPESQKVDQILAWLDLPDGARPGLILSWWHGCDSVGHQRGPDHPAVAKQLARQDRELARLLAGLDARDAWATTTLFVLSDHGMAAATRWIDVAEILKSKGIGARIFRGGGTAHLHLDDRHRRERALSLLSRAENIQAYASEQLPAKLRGYHPKRSGDIIVLTRPPYSFSRPSLIERALGRFGRIRGAHGYAPDHPAMGAIFFALGRGIPRGARLAEVRSIDVAPSVARLLGIDPPRHSEGRPISALGQMLSRGVEP